VHVAAYARVSTPRQAQDQTITQQVARLQAKVQAEGWTLATHQIYCDDGYSGARLDRPALDRLRDAAARGEFQALLLTTPDRLARRFVHQALLLEEFAQLGCTVVFLDQSLSQDPQAQLLGQIRGAVAESERALIAERTRRGRLAKLQAGRLLPWIHTPYGYRSDPEHPRDPTRLRIEEPEAQGVRQMFTWYAEEGLSIYGIAARLMQLRIPAPHGGQRWPPATVGGILRNEDYAGTAYGNRDHLVEPQRWRSERAAALRIRAQARRRPREDWIAIDIPPIIARELFARVQALRPLRQAQSPRNNTQHEYLLRTRVGCAVCGWAFSGRPRGPYAYYLCNGKRSLVSSGRPWRCPVRSVRADRLDAWVWEDICQVLSTPAIITEALRRASAGELLPTATSARVRQLQHARRTAQRQIERLVEAYTAEALTLDELQTRRAGLEERLRLLRQQEQELQWQQQQTLRLGELCANIETLCHATRTGLHALDFAGRRRIVELLVDRVLISHETVEIRYAIPLTGLGHNDKKGPLQLPYRSELLSG
jgi:site-specific DNA recombinase